MDVTQCLGTASYSGHIGSEHCLLVWEYGSSTLLLTQDIQDLSTAC